MAFGIAKVAVGCSELYDLVIYFIFFKAVVKWLRVPKEKVTLLPAVPGAVGQRAALVSPLAPHGVPARPGDNRCRGLRHRDRTRQSEQQRVCWSSELINADHAYSKE